MQAYIVYNTLFILAILIAFIFIVLRVWNKIFAGWNGEEEIVDKDCVYGEWSNWSNCNQDNIKKRTRPILTMHKGDGKKCKESDLIEEASCRNDCIYSDWSKCECDKKCGGGKCTQKRRIKREAINNGKPCNKEALERTIDCNTEPCDDGEDCIQEISYSECSRPCGGGKKTKTVVVKKEPVSGGKPCDQNQQDIQCNTEPCMKEGCVNLKNHASGKNLNHWKQFQEDDDGLAVWKISPGKIESLIYDEELCAPEDTSKDGEIYDTENRCEWIYDPDYLNFVSYSNKILCYNESVVDDIPHGAPKPHIHYRNRERFQDDPDCKWDIEETVCGFTRAPINNLNSYTY